MIKGPGFLTSLAHCRLRQRQPPAIVDVDEDRDGGGSSPSFSSSMEAISTCVQVFWCIFFLCWKVFAMPVGFPLLVVGFWDQVLNGC